jgi:hypothetical protein
VYRNINPAPFDTRDPKLFEQQSQQLKALNGFWERHFANQGLFIGAYTAFTSDAGFASALENHLRKLIERRSGKSSLVKAGIVPKLFLPRRVAGSAFLRRVVFRPSAASDGEDLFDALARRLTTQMGEQEGLSELIGHGQSAAGLSAHLRTATTAPAYPIDTALGQLTVKARQSGRIYL